MKLRQTLVVLASALVLAGIPAAVSATPGSGVSGVILAQGESDDGIVVRGRGTTDVVPRWIDREAALPHQSDKGPLSLRDRVQRHGYGEITIQPGGSTGWHYHDGQLIAVVKQGTLTRTMDDCSTEVTPAGESFVEPRGKNHVHLGRNLGTEPVILLVTYVLPDGKPLSQDAPAPAVCD
jgi:quercetin dioxygenase-like cupin family protein